VVEEICGDRKLDDGGVELLVRWKGGEETWEPYENVAALMVWLQTICIGTMMLLYAVE
jgi:hypothetical protein